jgi:hypothetical protein
VKPGTPFSEFEYIRIAADGSNDIITIAASDDENPSDLRHLYANKRCARLFRHRVEETSNEAAMSKLLSYKRKMLTRESPVEQLRSTIVRDFLQSSFYSLPISADAFEQQLVAQKAPSHAT